MAFSFDMVAGTDKRIVIAASDFTGDLNEALEIEFAIAKSQGEKANLCSCDPLTLEVYKTLSAAQILVTAPTEFRVDLVPADTEDLCGDYYFDARITDSNGKKYNVRGRSNTLGKITFSPNIVDEENYNGD